MKAKNNLSVIGLFIFCFLIAPKFGSAQTVDVTRDSFKQDTTVEILLNCKTTCKTFSGQVQIPASSIVPLKKPISVYTPNTSFFNTDTKDTVIEQFLGSNITPPRLVKKSYFYDPKPIYTWAEENLNKFEKEAQEPELEIENNRAVKFTPPSSGLKIDIAGTVNAIIEALQANEAKTYAITVNKAPNKKLSQTNNLGINELISKGESNFRGSPKNRRHNINIGVSKLKGMIIAPGEEFSFNKNICPVDKEGGWLPELVIKGADEGTVPEYGGGLCQVSSTTYRAAMKAGLPITMRKNHSYAVQYYSPQGSDATTYCGGIDFRFKNDTAGSILIWPYLVDKDNLAFDFYGTKDDRVVTLKKPVQYDRKSDGSMKAIWERTVVKDGKEKHDEFKSVYLPPALFHKEEKLDEPNQEKKVGTPTNTPALEPGTSN